MSGKQRDYSTEWSDWIWSDELGCKYATRRGPTGKIEYDYLRLDDTEGTPRDEGGWEGGNSSSYGPNSSSNTYASPSTEVAYDYPIPNDTRRYEEDWGRESIVDGRSISSQTYVTSNSPPNVKTTQYKVPTGFSQSSSGGASSSSRAMNDLTSKFGTTSLHSVPELGSITIQNPVGEQILATTITNSVDTDILDDRYVEIDERRNKKFWRVGRVFMMLWTEPARAEPIRRGVNNATDGSQYDTVWLGAPVYSEIRRFVVVGQGYGNVICSPIHTYSGQGTLKKNLPDPQQHAIIHTSSSPPKELFTYDEDGNEVRENLTKDPIRVVSELKGRDGDLGHYSRINYAKLYTVEKYVRILKIGRVHEDSMESLLASCFFARPVDEPPQGPRPQHKSSSSRGGSRHYTNDSKGQSSKTGYHRR